ncbi:metal dependent phosphohydrolase [Candidatus Magnetoovum chiemensis]|nr:metal dependent phosphohydrolase [Candidatus Magnetoovum chiemensis]
MELKKKNVYCPIAFKDLNDKELVAIYNAGVIKKVSENEVIVKEGETDTVLFFIIEGSVKVVKNILGKEREVSILSKGEWVGEIALIRSFKRTATVITKEPCSLFCLEEKSMRSLDAKIQLAIYKGLASIATTRINDLVKKEVEISNINKQITSHIKTLYFSKSSQYKNSEIINNIVNNIPTLPDFTKKMITRLLDPNVSAREAVGLNQMEKTLQDQILKTVNSDYYALQAKIQDIQKAILNLGFNQIYQLALTEGIKSIIPKDNAHNEILKKSLIISLIAYESARCTKTDKPALISSIGLFQHIGKSIVLMIEEKYHETSQLLPSDAYIYIGSLLLKSWGLPEIFYEVLEYQAFPEFLPPYEIPDAYRNIVAILYISNVCYDYLRGRYEGADDPPDALFHKYMDLLGITEDFLTKFMDRQLLPALNNRLAAMPQDFKNLLMFSGKL